MKKTYKLYSEKLVQRVNELYFDFVGEQYVRTHALMFEQEKERWERIAKQFFNFTDPVTIVDIGTGTGFVPLTIAKFLKKEDIFICFDISRSILEVAKQNINKQNFHCQFKFVKIESQVPFWLPLETKSIDIVTMNSVLHHVKDTNTFLSEVDRILKPNGLLFVGHEPNKYFYDHKFLWYNYLFINRFLEPKLTVVEISRKIHLYKIIKKIHYFMYPKKKETALEHKKIAHKINEVLLKEELTKKPLLPEEIEKIVDIKAREGFNPDSLLPRYELLHFETYNHIFWVTIRHCNNFIIRKYDDLLRRKFPKEGANFFVVFKKEQKLHVKPSKRREI